MKVNRLVQNFCPAKETNRTHSDGYVDDLLTQAGRKRCAKMMWLNVSVLPQGTKTARRGNPFGPFFCCVV